MHDLILKGGTLITPDGARQADLAITGEKIAAVGGDLAGKRVIDASGLFVLPGAVDPHVHLEMPAGATRSSDDWFTGTRAAAIGGTTTVIDFVEPQPGERLEHALHERRALAEGQAAVDFGLHMTVTEDSRETLADIEPLCAGGCVSFKTYLTYEGFRLSDAALLNVMAAVQAAGGIVLVHAENDAIIAYLKNSFRREGFTAPRYHALSRPAAAEGEAIGRALALAETAGAAVYIVHTSTARGVEAIQAARGRGVNAWGETCPQYLLLTDRELSRPGFEGAKFVCSPPLRSAADNEALWQALAAGGLQTVGTDHCPFYFDGQKTLGRESYEAIPGGLPGIEARLSLIYSFGVASGRMTAQRWVEVCCANPARIFGLYPRKGSLEPGADADVVLFDPHLQWTLTHARLHEQVDYTPYEGFKMQGSPVLTLLRGQVVAEGGEFRGRQGQGTYLRRERPGRAGGWRA